jgi:hypothetical protein
MVGEELNNLSHRLIKEEELKKSFIIYRSQEK